MTNLNFLQKFFLLLVMGFSLSIVCACGGDDNDEKIDIPIEEEGPVPENKPNDEPIEPSMEHEWVDLGLSVKWATCNIGASAPEEYGDYFAWGEIQIKEKYGWDTYKWASGVGDSLKMTKYYTLSDYGDDPDYIRLLKKEDDAASSEWGGKWRMPTKKEMNELCDSCTWIPCEKNGIFGMQIIGRNGNHIFLPAAGQDCGIIELGNQGKCGYYWTSERSFAYYACYLFFDKSTERYKLYDYAARCDGYTIRPVME